MERSIVLLMPGSPVPHTDDTPVHEVVKLVNVPHHPHVAVTSLREGGVVERGTIVVYKPHGSAAVWGAKFATVLEAIRSICECDVHWRPHDVHRPRDALFLGLIAANVAALWKVVVGAHTDVAWLEPHKYCWVPVAASVTSFDASPNKEGVTNVAAAGHGRPTWIGTIHGTIPDAQIVGAAVHLLNTPPSGLAVHMALASIIGAHLRRALRRGIKGPTSHFVNEHALNWVLEGFRRLPRRVGGPHHWVVRQSSH